MSHSFKLFMPFILALLLFGGLSISTDMTAAMAGPHLRQDAAPQAFCDNVNEIPQAECEALVALYNSTNGANWTNNSGWLDTNTPCSWLGVTCDGGRVTEIELPSNNLSGTLPAELGNLTNLQQLDLFSNQLSGPIPAELENLTNLTFLGLGNNQLSGPIPAELGNLTNLTSLWLGSNQLSGPIPTELGNLTNLERLGLSSNQLSGPMPIEFGNLTNLGYLDLSSNQLSGLIPTEFGNLANLVPLRLRSNQLSGPMPGELGHLTNLERLQLDGNNLSGPIPAELGNLANLVQLWLDSNQLEGPIPAELGNLTNLEDLSLGFNQLSGTIPAELGNLTNLTVLSLGINQLSGTIPNWIGDLTNLTYLWLGGNDLSGTIPTELGNLANLGLLRLEDNQLSGTIPNWIGDLTNLTTLWLGGNDLSGTIPAELGNLTNLETFHLSSSQLSGPIPNWIGDLSNLWWLDLSSNQLSGPIPAELGNLANLKWLYLSFNQLSGPIPAELGNLTNLEQLDLGYNMLRADDAALITWLNTEDPDWADTQTVPPTNLQVSGVTHQAIELAWTPIAYSGDSGHYEISYGTSFGGPYTVHGTTSDKSASGYLVNQLSADTDYYFVVRTFTAAHDSQQNDLLSEPTAEILAMTPVTSTYTALSDIVLSASATGHSNIPYFFEAYVSPPTATTPITYTWQATEQPTKRLISNHSSSVDYTWSAAGVKTVVVTATNGLGFVSASHQITISVPAGPNPDTPPTSVTLWAPTTWESFSPLSLFATANPTATRPISFTWQATEQAPITEISDAGSEVFWSWNRSGVKTIVVTASNEFGAISTTHQITIAAGTPPQTVTLSGATIGEQNIAHSFLAQVGPPTTTWPVTYTWQATDHAPRTALDGSVNLQDYSWSSPGVKTLVLTASNAFGAVSASHLITIPNDIRGSMAGMVTSGGNPLANISIQVYRQNNNVWQLVKSAQSDANGLYQVDGLRAGTYRVGAFDWASSQSYQYAPKYYLNATDLSSATDVVVNAGQTTPNINIALDQPGQITGTVTDPDGNPVENIDVEASRNNGNSWDWGGWAHTDAQGRYTVTGLISGTYRLGFFDFNSLNSGQYADKYYQNATDLESATDVTVSADNTTSGIDVQLDQGGRISGTVSSTSGTPLANIEVQAYEQNGNEWHWAGWTSTDDNGQYTLNGLSSGNYRVSFFDSQAGYGKRLYYQNANEFANATNVSVTAGQVTPNINMSWPQFATITGSVSTHDGQPAPQVYVRVYQQINGQWQWTGNSTQTDSQGQYHVRGLLAGTYRVSFFEETNSYAYEYYDDVADLANATDVTVTDGNITPNINAQLPAPVDPLVDVEGGNGQTVAVDPQTGEVTIGQPRGNRSDITITKVVTCTNGTPSDVFLIMGANQYAMTEDPAGSGSYSATIPRDQLQDNAELSISKNCGGGSEEETIGQIERFDPSGYLTDSVTGDPVVGATVTLYKVPNWQAKQSPQDNRANTCQSNLSKAADEPWNQAVSQQGVVADPDSGEIDPTQNPLISNEEGYYAWDVAAGCWYVVVEAAGYEPLTSTVVGVPPAVTDLNLTLTPFTANFSANPTSGQAPLAVQFTNHSTGDYQTCMWDFGDGNQSNDCNNPSHTYTAGGVYHVTLTVNGAGWTDTLTQSNYINVTAAPQPTNTPVPPAPTPTSTPTPTPTSTPTVSPTPTNTPMADNDNDGVGNETENGAPNNGDGNNDGTPDSQQVNVASLPNINGQYVTLAAPTNMTLVHVEAKPMPDNAPEEVQFQQGLFDFALNGLANGEAVSVTLMLHEGENPNTYWKLDENSPQWFEFDFEQKSNTGAQIDGNTITLHFVDGQRGDADGQANGVIDDPGAPGIMMPPSMVSLANFEGQTTMLSQRLKFTALLLLMVSVGLFIRLRRS